MSGKVPGIPNINSHGPGSQAKSGGGSRKKRPALSPDVKLSKSMSSILRHNAVKVGLNISSDGFVKLDELLSCKELKSSKATYEDVKRIVDNNDKQRFKLEQRLDPETGVETWYIRANQGHTLEVKDLELKPLLTIDDFPTRQAIHGTNINAWNSGIKNQGLSKMKRSHIHMAIGLPGDNDVISGMRKMAKVHIYIDIVKALEAGIPFFLSSNNVILSPGNSDGFIPPEFFLKVEGI